jgi:hypothetical protein
MLTRSLIRFKPSRALEVMKHAQAQPECLLFRYGCWGQKVPYSSGDLYGQAFQRVIPLFCLSVHDWKYMQFIGANSEPILPDTPLPGTLDAAMSGCSRDSPILLTLITNMYFNVGGRTKAVSIKGCETIGDVAKRVMETFTTRASCSDQLVFRIPPSKVPVDHSTPLPNPSLHQADNPILVKPMVKTILLAEVKEGCVTNQFKSRSITSDAEVTYKSEGMRRVTEPGEKEPPLLTRLHELEDGQRYEPDLGDESKFDKWQLNESQSMETETGRAILKEAAERGIALTPLSKIIKDDVGKQQRQEWDAAFYDYANHHLYLCEAKHKMKIEHVREVQNKLNLLPGYMQCTATPLYPDLKPVRTIVILASGVFEEEVKAEAVANGYNLCYPSGDRYCVESLKSIRLAGSDSVESVLA